MKTIGGNLSDSIEKETASESNSEPKESDLGEHVSESGSEEEQAENENTTLIKTKVLDPCQHCESSNGYDNFVMRCAKCLWGDNRKLFPVCDYTIPFQRKPSKHTLRRCCDCGVITHQNEKTSELEF